MRGIANGSSRLFNFGESFTLNGNDEMSDGSCWREGLYFDWDMVSFVVHDGEDLRFMGMCLSWSPLV